MYVIILQIICFINISIYAEIIFFYTRQEKILVEILYPNHIF